MAQPFGVGDLVGGRYRITHHVVTSADQDIVFQASDEVLDRDVSILLASRSNAKQVATSARELAMGSRDSHVQVLDLGLAEERTYLISSLVDPNTLLDLVVPDTAPYVEPFFTDSLGSELFGQSRIMEPETYEDDDEYYAGLHAGSAEDRSEDPARRFRRRRPAFLDKVSDSLNRRLNTDNDAAAHAVAAGQAAGQADQARAAAAAAYLRSDMELTSADPEADTAEDFSGTRSTSTTASSQASQDQEPTAPEEDFSSVPTEAGQGATSDASEGFAPQDSPSAQPTQVQSASTQSTSTPSTSTPSAPAQDAERLDGDEVVDDPPDSFVEDEDLPLAPAAPPLPGPPRSPGLGDGISFTGLIRPVPRLDDDAALQAPSSASDAGVQSSGPAHTQNSSSEPEGTAAVGSSGAGTEPQVGAPADTDFQDEKPSIGRWITAAVLAAVLLVAALIMFMNLRGGETEDASDAQGQDEGTGESSAEDSGAEEGGDEGDQEPGTEESAPTEAAAAAPEIANITRVVPDSPDLISDRDGQLANLLDGDTATTWVTLSFATADFGGFSSGVGLVAELQEPTELSSVTVTQQGDSSGGSFEILVNDTPSFEGAEQVGSGTLNWNETTVEVEPEGEVGYVILNITELPSQATPNAAGLPFSAELAEISFD